MPLHRSSPERSHVLRAEWFLLVHARSDAWPGTTTPRLHSARREGARDHASRPHGASANVPVALMVHSAAFASGALETTPFIYILASLLERRLTGTLVLETQLGAKSAISFVRGAPTKVKTASPVARLALLLAEAGYLDQQECEPLREGARQAGVLCGEHLLNTRVIDAATLERALRSQLLRKLRWVAQLPGSTGYGFYENQDFLARWAGEGVRISPLLVIWDLTRTLPELPNLTERVRRYDARALELDSRADIGGFGFEAAERSLVESLVGHPRTLAELRQRQLVSESILQRLVYVLGLTRQLELHSEAEATPLGFGSDLATCVELLEPRKPLTSPSAAAGPPMETEPTASPGARVNSPAVTSVDPKVAREVAARREQIMALAARCETLDHYELLGVPRDATSPQIQAAFLEAAKRFHPDKLGSELADLRPTSAKLFARITEARQTLTNARSRTEYDTKRAQGMTRQVDEQHRIQEIVNAATCFQKAEVFLKKRMLGPAEQEAKRAHESDPEQADYLALLSWIQANKPDSAAKLPEILAQLSAAVHMSPESEKIRFYRAQVLTRLGRHLEAVNDYRLVVAKNPHNIDAQREIRLWEMRQHGAHAAQSQQRPDPPVPKGGVLSKLFKR